MANELKIRVVFDTGEAQSNIGKVSKATKEYAEGTIGALEASLRKAKLAYKDLHEGTQAQIDALVKLKQLEAQVADATGRNIRATNNMAGASANAAMTLQSLNYTIRDAPYFARDFSLGLLAVGNNLNPLIDGFIRMKTETGSYGGALKSLTSMLVGPQGLMFAFSIAVTAIQAITFALAKNKSETESTSKSVDELTDKYRTLAEKASKAAEQMGNIAIADFPATYRALTKEVENSSKAYDELIKKIEHLNELQNSTMAGKGRGFGALYAFLFGPSKEDKKKAEEDLAKMQSQRVELLRQTDLLMKAQEKGKSAGLSGFIAGISIKDANDLEQTFRDIGESLLPNMPKQFGPLGKEITITKEEALKLADSIKGILNPKDTKTPAQTSAWDVSLDKLEAKIEDFAERVKASLSLNKILEESAEGVTELPSTLKEINSILKDYKTDMEDITKLEILLGDKSKERLQVTSDTVAKLQRLKEEISDSSIEALMKGQMDKERKKDTTKVELENAKDVTQDISEYMKEIEDKQREINATANDVGNSLFNAFIQGKKGLDEFLESLALAVAKMLFIRAITSLLGIATGGAATPALSAVGAAGGIGVGIDSKVASNIPQISTGGVSFNTNNKQIVQRLDALNANLAMLQPNVTVVSNVPGLEFTKQVTNKAQRRLTKNNIKA